MTFRKALMLGVAAIVALGEAGTACSQAPAAPPAAQPSNAYESHAYEKIAITNPDVQAAVNVALAHERQKNREDVKLVSIVSAERQAVLARNLRLCLSTDRSGNTELARVVLSLNAKKQWSVTIWSWGSCGR